MSISFFKKENLFLLLLLLFSGNCLVAQEEVTQKPKVQRKEIGFNMTPLATILLPFNRAKATDVGPYLLRFKTSGKARKSAFRFSLGCALSDNLVNPQLALGMGWEKKRFISKKWAYSRGFDFMLFGGPLNIPGGGDENGIFAVGPVWGIEYFLNEQVSISTEAVFSAGWSFDSEFFAFQVIPPIGLFLNHHF